jgi:hypothetical protein
MANMKDLAISSINDLVPRYQDRIDYIQKFESSKHGLPCVRRHLLLKCQNLSMVVIPSRKPGRSVPGFISLDGTILEIEL